MSLFREKGDPHVGRPRKTPKRLDRLEAMNAAIDEAERARDEYVKEVQSTCPHPEESIREGDMDQRFGATVPPFRVCVECGYAEQDWHIGYWKLAPQTYSGIPRLSPDEAQKYVARFFTQEDIVALKYPDAPRAATA